MREQHPCPFLRPLHPNADPPALVWRARQHVGHGRHIVAQVHHSADDRSLFGVRPRTSCSMYQQHREHRDAPGDESPLHRRAADADKTRPGLEWEGHKAQLTAVAARRASEHPQVADVDEEQQEEEDAPRHTPLTPEEMQAALRRDYDRLAKARAGLLPVLECCVCSEQMGTKEVVSTIVPTTAELFAPLRDSSAVPVL